MFARALVDEDTGVIQVARLCGFHERGPHADTPDMAIEFPDSHPDELDARGLGEIGCVGTPAAITNAVFHATGRRLRELPLTPDQLLRAG